MENQTTTMEIPTISQALTAAPVAETSRLKVLDALRGVALLGILLMNIPGFSMADYSFEAFKNDPTNVNFWVNAVISVFFEGKMRAMFGMIFGAGILLFIANKSDKGASVHALFYRRMFWLVLFGLIHAHLILWIGDILYLYGVCGMVVYLFRNVPAKYLVWAVPLVAIMDFSSNTLFYQDLRAKRIAYVDATKAQTANQTLTDAQTKALTTWREVEKTMIPNREDAKTNTQTMKSNYTAIANYLRPIAFEFETKHLPMWGLDSLALMLLGLALFKWGFLTGSWSNDDYWKVLKIGYCIGLPLAMYEFYYGFQNFTTLEANLARMERVPINWVSLIYPFQRILLVMAHASALILLYKSGKIQGLFRRLEAVGQMAFTNYISHSVICTLFFFGYGLNYYAELEYYQIYFLALAIWVFQLIISPIWLKYYLFGPLEWVWRSLTYWKLQPFKRE
jgi:uncharacterized protein